MRSIVALLVPAVLLFLIANANATDGWPELRGPDGDGHAAGSQLPTHWSESENVRWKIETPGQGWSTPLIAGDHIWMSSADEDGHNLFALCVHRTDGSIVHQVPLFEIAEPEPKNAMNSYASPTGVIADGRVFFSFGTYGIACLDADTGDVLWSRDDVKLDHQEGPGSSLIVFRDRLILHCDGRDVQYLTSLDCATGDTVWRRDRSLDLSHVGDHARKAFTTPLVVATEQGELLVSPAAQGCYAYDPIDGREVWRLAYPGFSAIPKALVHEGLTYVVDGYARPKIYAVQYDGAGDLLESHIAWIHSDNSPATASPIVIDDQLLFVSNSGILSGLNATTGDPLFQHRLGGNFAASPIAAGGLLYFFDQEGVSTVIRPSAAGDGETTIEVIATNSLDEGLMASPSVSGNDLYLRTPSFLYRIGE